MKEKINKCISSFDYIVYILSDVTKMQLFWSKLMTNDVMPRVLIINYYIILLLFWDNLKRSIQIIGWPYIMTCGPM
jgi:hypothetical protein